MLSSTPNSFLFYLLVCDSAFLSFSALPFLLLHSNLNGEGIDLDGPFFERLGVRGKVFRGFFVWVFVIFNILGANLCAPVVPV